MTIIASTKVTPETAQVQRARKMPRQKPGLSESSVGTDPRLIAAVIKRFGKLDVDLAATRADTVAPRYITPQQDSLAPDERWSRHHGNLWLNPPFSHIAPWAKKCAETPCVGRQILFLVPASVGSNWFEQYVYKKAMVLFLKPRLIFVNHTDPYPKDLMLCLYAKRIEQSFDIWKWV